MKSEQALLDADRKAREQALDTSRSFIVQAPAGSGKTELLIQRYLRLLACVDEPEEILAITFTRKAAAEMRLRIVAAMRDAAAGVQADAEHRKVTAAAAAAVLERDAALDWDILGNPGRMRIQTLDSLNASIVRMLPLTAPGTGGGVVVADEHEMQRIYEEAAAATLDWLTAGDDTGRSARSVLEHLDGNTGSYIAELAAMLKTRDQWLPFVGTGQMTPGESEALRAHLESKLSYVIEHRLQVVLAGFQVELEPELLSLLGYARQQLVAAGQADHGIVRYCNDTALPPANADGLAGWVAIADSLLTASGAPRKQVNKNHGFPPGDKGEKAAMHDLLARVAGNSTFVAALAAVPKLPPARYPDSQWAILCDLLRLLPIAVGELQRLCQGRGVTDYIEIARSAGEAIGSADDPGDIALLLDYQVRHILVDEMQDTSTAQYRMLGAFTGGWVDGDGRTLFCVGDPMQSIYRFRNAEVAQFLLAADHGIGNVSLTPLLLRQNFRSGERLVDWFNEVFPQVLPARSDPVSGAISYSASVPAPHLAGQGECRVHPVFGASTRAEAQKGADVVAGLVGLHPDDTVAVLVRGRTRLPALLECLRSAGVAYQAVDIDRITDLPEIIDLLALTRALAHDGDRVAWLGLLRAPWAGLDWTDHHRLVQDAPDLTLPEVLADASRLGRLSEDGRRAARKLNDVIEKYRHPDRLTTLSSRVELAWIELGGAASSVDANAVENIYLYLDALTKLETAGTLADIADLVPQLDTIRASASQSANVQIMTMHKSKGLQFDHVVLYGLGRHSRGDQGAVLRWLDLPGADGRFDKLIGPVGRRDEEDRDPIHVFIGHTAREKDRHEDGRLLYVACTRARQSLHLVGHVSVDEDGGMKPPDSRSLLYRLWPAVERDFTTEFDRGDFTLEKDDEEVFVDPPLRRQSSPWRMPVIPAVPGQVPAGETIDDEQAVEYDWVGSAARHAGTVVHRWLQVIASGKEASPADIRAVSRKWLVEMGASPDAVGDICDRVVMALDAVANDSKGQWLLSGEGEAELPLTGMVAGRIESVLIDRVRIDDDGTHWIVDYKTSAHEGGDLEGFLAAECRRYRPQLEKYAGLYAAYSEQPIRCALYFPLLARFVEVPIEQV